jgi:predicted transcriptional regulator
MKQEDELAMKVTKEIVIKFIEMGRLSVNNFDEVFRQVHSTVTDTLAESSQAGKEKGKGPTVSKA